MKESEQASTTLCTPAYNDYYDLGYNFELTNKMTSNSNSDGKDIYDSTANDGDDGQVSE